MLAARLDGGTQGLVQVMAAAALWATVGVAAQLVPDERSLSAEAMGVARMALGGPVILLIAALIGRARLTAFRRLAPGPLAGFALGCMVFQVCLFRAFDSLGVTVTVFLTVCLPPILACLWTCLRGRQLSAGTGRALVLGVAGVLVFVLATGRGAAGTMAAEGLALALVASVAFVVMSCCARDLTRSAGPLVVAGTGLTLAGVILLLGVLAFEPQAIRLSSGEGWALLALLAYLVLCPTALAYVIFCTGMARCRSPHAGLIASMIEPGLAALLAWAVLGERLSAAEALGCGLIALAMIALWRAEGRGQAA